MYKSIPIIFIFVFLLIMTACTSNATDSASQHEQSEVNSDQHSKTVLHAQELLPFFEKNQLVNDSDVIIFGTVLSQEVQKDFKGHPATDTFIQVETVYKGEPAETVEVRASGGETDDMIYVVNEGPLTFDIGEEVVVFLSHNKGSLPDKDYFGYYVVGLTQGKFSVDTQSNGIIENGTGTYSFNFNNLQNEIDDLEEYNKTHDVSRVILPEG